MKEGERGALEKTFYGEAKSAGLISGLLLIRNLSRGKKVGESNCKHDLLAHAMSGKNGDVLPTRCLNVFGELLANKRLQGFCSSE